MLGEGDMIRDHLDHMERRGLSVETCNIRRRRLAMFDREVGLRDASWQDIENFLDSRRGRDGGPLTPKARYDWISHLHKFYGWAVDFGHLDRDPTRQVTRPRTRPGKATRSWLPRPSAGARATSGSILPR